MVWCVKITRFSLPVFIARPLTFRIQTIYFLFFWVSAFKGNFFDQVGHQTMYRVAQQCCPGGNRPETPRRPSAGGLRIFWVKSLVILAIYTKIKLKFVYMAVITSDLAKKIRRPPAEGLRWVSGRFPPRQHWWSARYLGKDPKGPLQLLCGGILLTWKDSTKAANRNLKGLSRWNAPTEGL